MNVRTTVPLGSTISIVTFCAGFLTQYLICAVRYDRIASSGANRKMSGVDAELRAELAERADVVEHVERPAVRGDHQVRVFHPDVRDRDVRQVQRQRVPGAAVVVRVVDAVLRAGVEQVAALVILADRVRVVVRLQAGDDLRPRTCRSRASGTGTARGRRAAGASRPHTRCPRRTPTRR